MHLILRSLHNAASENTSSKYQVKTYATLKYMYAYIHTHTHQCFKCTCEKKQV